MSLLARGIGGVRDPPGSDWLFSCPTVWLRERRAGRSRSDKVEQR